MNPLAALTIASLSAAPFLPKNRPYDVQHYALDVRLHEDGTFGNKVTITLKPKHALNEVELDAYGLSVATASVDGASATFTLKEDPAERTGLLTVKPAKALAAGKDVKLEILYAGKAIRNHEGFFQVPAEGAGGLPSYFTQFEATFARRFFPCNDEPADKATTELTAIVDSRYQVLSNGKKVLDEVFTDKEEHLRRVHWVQDKPHSTYLVALAVGQFEEAEVDGDIPSVVHVPLHQKDLAFVATDATHSALETEAKFLGVKYPWDKADLVAVPHFYWGGMENTSIVFGRADRVLVNAKNEHYERDLRVGLVAHELAHQWFGDLVTLKWWDDTWLNEGFATYLGPKAVTAFFDNDVEQVTRVEYLFVDYLREEDGPRAHPLAGRGAVSIADMFDRTSYVKGAAILQMLENWLGIDPFRKAITAYLNQYAYGNATSEDFFATIGKSTKKEKEVKAFKEAWLKKRGYPVVAPKVELSGNTATVTVSQRPNHDDEKGPFVFQLPVVFHRESEPKFSVPLKIWVDKATVTAKLELPGTPEWVNWNEGGQALVRVDPSAVNEQQWTAAARKDPDPAWRLLAQYALLGELVNPMAKTEVRPSDAAFDALADALASDPSPYVRAAVLRRLAMARWKRLGKELGPVTLALAKNPQGLPEDPMGLVTVKHEAMAALGKLETVEGHQFLIDRLAKKDLDINYVGGVAEGTGRIGTPEALAAVRAALALGKTRGYPYYLAAAGGLGAVASTDAVPAIGQFFHENAGDEEAIRAVVNTLEDNFTVLDSQEFAVLVHDTVLGVELGDELKARILDLLDEVKTPGAKETLQAIQGRSDSQRLKDKAQQMLDHNFPEPAPAPKKKGR